MTLYIINKADYGGSIMLKSTAMVKFQEQVKLIFKDNVAIVAGGAICSIMASNVFLVQHSTIIFYTSSSNFGDIVLTEDNSSIPITTNSTVKFNNNTATWYSSIPYISNKNKYSDITFDINGTVSCGDLEKLPVCIHHSCFCQVIDYVLVSLTSNTQIYISIDMTLSSAITLSELNNISIVGHHSPTIKCTNAAGVKFISCYNCTIKGIDWDGCGAKIINGSMLPVIQFHHSINITVQNCMFQHLEGQAVVLSEVSGNVEIDHCRFLHNNLFEGHGTAIYVSSSNNLEKDTQLLFTINNSKFQ